MYNFVIALYVFAVKIASLFNKKAKLLIAGQKKTFDILKQNIDLQSEYIWFHAASLGEFEQGRPLLEKIKKEKTEYKILLTFFSPSGYEVKKNYPFAEVICYLPFDIKKNVRTFLDLANPAMTVFIKYEFWKNYLNELKTRSIPIYIISALFRPNQIFFRPYGKDYRKILKNYNRFFVQDENSKQLLNKHGIQNVIVSGDTRFDRVYEIYEQRKDLPLIDKYLSKTTDSKKNILVAGSTWPKDEELIISYFNRKPDIKLIIAPHEITENRIQAITSQLKRPYLLYSEMAESTVAEADCLVIDCFGLLSSIYRYGDIAYIGGGFGVGIHNTLEAAVYNIPVIFGPNYQRFKEAKDLIAAGGGISISNAGELNSRINELLACAHLLSETGEKAGKFVCQNLGATERIFKEIKAIL
ncbi:MAG: 3-deoxy-D-manno-octulosonic acid transferase [Dysgonamonadaceae bacterium]|jgi:3-deoxy-D-manno-octulosonic-acid transferase|nr:3-deoxy-D-manno-octulosonic acid transferase [Dysgonamonadaceae bacterium]